MTKKHLAQKAACFLHFIPYYTVLPTFPYCPNFLGFEEGDGRGILRNVILKTKHILQSCFLHIGPG